ncbi:MAG: hypothetical protein JJ959_11430 [Nisaea sp.]|uniref:hypothetical protein n=1 Tax=Nisaea sp. TaxID=2024842 RepID=UPI001B06F577|nr:hypothetical protein [Nisaea sp.]MBO6561144.1 hypothetical protein [Nisaea sp.]
MENPGEQYLKAQGLSPLMLEHIGAIAVFSGSFELWAERIVWRLKNEEPKGTHPTTDGHPISSLIKSILTASDAHQNRRLANLTIAWARAAKPTTECRNSIFHGLGVNLAETTIFMKGASWSGELRKRSPSEFHADEHTLLLLREACGDLAYIAQKLATETGIEESHHRSEFADFRSRLSQIKSITQELCDLTAAVNHEKY